MTHFFGMQSDKRYNQFASTSKATANNFNPAILLLFNFYLRHIWKELWAVIPGDQIIAQKINTSESMKQSGVQRQTKKKLIQNWTAGKSERSGLELSCPRAQTRAGGHVRHICADVCVHESKKPTWLNLGCVPVLSGMKTPTWLLSLLVDAEGFASPPCFWMCWVYKDKKKRLL